MAKKSKQVNEGLTELQMAGWGSTEGSLVNAKSEPNRSGIR